MHFSTNRLWLMIGFLCLSCAIASAKRINYLSKEKAIQIAKRHAYFKESKDWREPEVRLDSVKQWWIITNSKIKHITKGTCYPEKCKCEQTNGCTELAQRIIRIHATNGRVLKKWKVYKRIPNYE